MNTESREGCQIPNLQCLSEGRADSGPQALRFRLKRALAKPWNYQVKKRLKSLWRFWSNGKRGNTGRASSTQVRPPVAHLKTGDRVRVRPAEEIRATLDPFKELRGCAFLEEMWAYCGTTQRVLQPLERFLDERDYRVKKCSGIALLENVICHGTPVFGRCDRCCFLFWREEWLERLPPE